MSSNNDQSATKKIQTLCRIVTRLEAVEHDTTLVHPILAEQNKLPILIDLASLPVWAPSGYCFWPCSLRNVISALPSTLTTDTAPTIRIFIFAMYNPGATNQHSPSNATPTVGPANSSSFESLAMLSARHSQGSGYSAFIEYGHRSTFEHGHDGTQNLAFREQTNVNILSIVIARSNRWTVIPPPLFVVLNWAGTWNHASCVRTLCYLYFILLFSFCFSFCVVSLRLLDVLLLPDRSFIAVCDSNIYFHSRTSKFCLPCARRCGWIDSIVA